MTQAWRQAGLTYVQYSNICARLVRQALKADIRVAAEKRNDTHVKIAHYEGGKPVLKEASNK